jgi:hypothetical protein
VNGFKKSTDWAETGLITGAVVTAPIVPLSAALTTAALIEPYVAPIIEKSSGQMPQQQSDDLYNRTNKALDQTAK